MHDGECHWRKLCVALGCDLHRAEDIWSTIAAAYAEPWRHYHTMDHISALLALRRQHASLFQNPEIADLAIILHDVVYEPQRKDNEAASAAWARARLTDLAIAAERIDTVAHLIEMSRHDAASLAAVAPASDLAHFLDLDLSILAADAPAYAAYAAAIRREYAIYPDDAYRAGRAKVLRSFLQRPALYCSAHFRALWEQRARANLTREIADLTA